MDAEGRLDFRDAAVAMREAVGFLESHEECLVGEKIRIGCLTRLELTPETDFGEEWMGSACSQNYWDKVVSVRRSKDFLACVCEELRRLTRDASAVRLLWRHFMGGKDCYRLVLEDRFPHLYSYNMRGDLSWGARLKNPKDLSIIVTPDDYCEDTVFIFYPWLLSGRLQDDILEVELTGKPVTFSAHYFNSFPHF